MDSLITAAAQALARGDPLGALKRVSLRDDPPALALRGIAMAQLGEHPRARELLRSAARGFGAREIAELRHRDAAQRQRRRVVAQRDPVQGAERITRGKRPRRGRDQRVHGHPDTLVTLTFPSASPMYRTTPDERSDRT